MPDFSPIILVGAFAYVIALVLVTVMPALGFGLLLTIPLIKVVLRPLALGLLSGYTYDIAVVMLALVGAAAYHAKRGGRFNLNLPSGFVLAWLTICIMLWLRIPGSRNADYGFKKALIFSIFNTMAVLTIPLYLMSPFEGRRLLRMFVLAGLAASAALPIFGSTLGDYKGARVTIAGGSPLGMADLSATVVIILISMYVGSRSPKLLMTSLFVIPFCLFAIFLTGTRGPIVALPLLLVPLFWIYRRRLNFQAALATMVGIGMIIGATGFILDPTSLARFTPEHIMAGLQDRFTMTGVALEGIVRSPFLGNGSGDSAFQLSGVSDKEIYPHNQFLEITNELGVLGMIAWLALMIYGCKAGWELNRPEWEGTEAKYVGVPIFMGFLYGLLMSFKAGTFAANYMTYFYLVATITLYQLRQADRQRWQAQYRQWQQWLAHEQAVKASRYIKPRPTPSG